MRKDLLASMPRDRTSHSLDALTSAPDDSRAALIGHAKYKAPQRFYAGFNMTF